MKRILKDKTIYKCQGYINIKNKHILYMLHNWLYIHLDIIEIIADIDIENLCNILSLESIKDIKHYEYN
jgi:hypothetical protein